MILGNDFYTPPQTKHTSLELVDLLRLIRRRFQSRLFF